MNEQQKELKHNVEDKLMQKIVDLEAVRISLEEDVRDSVGGEQEKNKKLLEATDLLLEQLRLARLNLQALNVD